MMRTQEIFRFRFAAAALLFLAVIFISGCAHKDVKPNPKPVIHAGPKTAVAPMENKTNYLGASDIIRDAFIEGLSEQGYAVMPVLESDAVLREELGISYGGQLPVTTPQDVCAALGVEGVFYGEVEEFGKTTTGFYNSAYVAASFQLYGKDGALLWEGKDRYDMKDMARGDSRSLLMEALIRGLGNLLINPLTPLGKQVGRNIARQTPSGLLPEESKTPNKPASPDEAKSPDEIKAAPGSAAPDESGASEAPKPPVKPDKPKIADEHKPKGDSKTSSTGKE